MSGDLFKIFVSYSTTNLEHVEELRRALEGSPVRVFVAEHDVMPGESLPSTIEEAIDQCDLFFLVWTEQAEASQWVKRELARAEQKSKYLVPLVFSSAVALPLFVQDLKYIDASQNRQAAFQAARRLVMARVEQKFQQPVVAEAGADSQSGQVSDISQLAALAVFGILLWAFTRK